MNKQLAVYVDDIPKLVTQYLLSWNELSGKPLFAATSREQGAVISLRAGDRLNVKMPARASGTCCYVSGILRLVSFAGFFLGPS